jgi:hypothetical protein
MMLTANSKQWNPSSAKDARFRCQNPTCGREVYLPSTAQRFGANPHCSCGAEMKRVYFAPKVRRLTKEQTDASTE